MNAFIGQCTNFREAIIGNMFLRANNNSNGHYPLRKWRWIQNRAVSLAIEMKLGRNVENIVIVEDKDAVFCFWHQLFR